MKKQNDFSGLENIRLDKKIEDTLKKEFLLPEGVEEARQKAFAQIRDRERQQNSRKKVTEKMLRRRFFRGMAGIAAAAAVFFSVCITNPAFAAQVPLVGHVFEEIGQSLGFGGDFSEYSKPLEEGKEQQAPEAITTERNEAVSGMGKSGQTDGEGTGSASGYTQTKNGMTITLSEVYCNDLALYVSMVLQSEKPFPDTMMLQNSENPLIALERGTLTFDYSEQPFLLEGGGLLEGKMVDDRTFAGVMRYDLQFVKNSTDHKEYKTPESFTVKLEIPQVVGTLPNPSVPEMPEDIRSEYEQSMKEHGLGTNEEDYAGFTEEQQEMEHQLFQEMYRKYEERYPETAQYPNKYENWWVDGPWEFTMDVTKDDRQTVVKVINDVDENGIGLISVTKTPFEMIVEAGDNPDTFTVVLDANGEKLENGTFGGACNMLSVSGRDVSKAEVYICDYEEYMDELKGYWYSEEKSSEKSFQEILEERALYHKQIIF